MLSRHPGRPRAACPSKKPPMARCRIRVLMRTVMASLAEQYVGDPVRPCPLLRDGQEFDVPASLEKPPGMCDWAWADLRAAIQAVNAGKPDKLVSCCTDGYRPVFFLLERLA